jgi:hypothetical protein
MKRVTGIGGIFFSANDLSHCELGTSGTWASTSRNGEAPRSTWTDAAGNPTKGTTAWLIGAADGKHFAPSKSTFMVNYRVEDLAAYFRRFGRRMQRPG